MELEPGLEKQHLKATHSMRNVKKWTEKKLFRISPPSSLSRRSVSTVLGLAAALTLSGCITTGANKGPALPTAQLPDYRAGMSFSFDDGVNETVLAQDGEVLTWRTDTGVVRTRYRNFLIPYLSWQNSTQRSKTKTDVSPTALWPLKIGNQKFFSIKQTVEKNDGTGKREFSQDWQCVIDGTEKVTVPAGTFDTYRIPCHRYYRQFWRQTKTYFYSPKVGHYVLYKDDSSARPSQRRRLVSYGFDSAVLPAADRRTRQTAIQQALERSKDGVGVRWQNSNGRVTGVVTPVRTIKVKGEGKCRIYKRAISAFGHTKSGQGKACRKNNGIWWEVN